jgi:hypothetical protein
MQHAIEGEHMATRTSGPQDAIATLHSDGRQGMVKLTLTPDQQRTLLRENPTTFTPACGAWGRQGVEQPLRTALWWEPAPHVVGVVNHG